MGKLKKTFKDKYPNLSQELETQPPTLKLNVAKQDPPNAQSPTNPLKGFIPTAIDYLRRCSTVEEAEEIISYLEESKEISSEEAKRLRHQLHNQGLESFGPKKTTGYYSRHNPQPVEKR